MVGMSIPVPSVLSQSRVTVVLQPEKDLPMQIYKSLVNDIISQTNHYCIKLDHDVLVCERINFSVSGVILEA